MTPKTTNGAASRNKIPSLNAAARGCAAGDSSARRHIGDCAQAVAGVKHVSQLTIRSIPFETRSASEASAHLANP